MPSYNAPGIYFQDKKSGSQSISQMSNSVGAMIGVARSGAINEPTLVTSFTEFISLFANGLDTPFLAEGDLPYAVNGFFANGGQKLYVTRVASKTAKKASIAVTTGINATAKHVGTWGNAITIKIAENVDFKAQENKVYDVIVSLGTSDKVTVTELTKATLGKVMANSKIAGWLESFDFTPNDLAVAESTLAGGVDGISDLTDTDYINALNTFDTVEEITLVAIPGQTTPVVNAGVIAYCDNRNLFPILDMPLASTTKETKAYRRTISANGGCLVYPWGRMNDPLTNTIINVPACGHVMGVYARTIESRGVHKAPAGIEANLKGFVGLARNVTDSDISELNPVGVVCLTTKPNAGIVVWGARGLNPDSTMKYVTDVLVNYSIKRDLKNGTLFAIFEPNEEGLWSRVKATCEAYLESLRLNGTLKGSAKEAYYVVVNGTNNTEASIAEGFLNIEIGYAPVKPTEFVVIKLAHSVEA